YSIAVDVCRGWIEYLPAENSLSLQTRRDGARTHHAGLKSRPLIIGKEERFLFLNWTAEHESILVSPKTWLETRGRKQIPRIQSLVPEKLERAAVEAIRARLVVNHDRSAVGSSVFRGVTVCLHAKLFDRIRHRKVSHLPGFGLKHADTVVDV